MADNDKLKRSRPGQTQEEPNSPSNEAGLYRHPESGEEAVTLYDPLYGNAQSEAFIRLGFRRVGDAPEGYTKTVVGSGADAARQTFEQVANDRSIGNNSEDVKGIQARLSVLESQTKAKDDQIAALEAQLKAQTEARGTDNTGLTTESSGTNTGSGDPLASDTSGNQQGGVGAEGEDLNATQEQQEEKSLEDQNVTELRETAAKEGVDLSTSDTKKQIRAAIEKKRSEKKEGE
jgi:hypothetical protein